MTYGIWCVVSGGVTGRREAWLKQDGEIAVFEDRAEAEALAAHYNAQTNGNPYRTASFSYTVRDYGDGGFSERRDDDEWMRGWGGFHPAPRRPWR
jgi:hypothetical protein